ncbi:hypothetical protein BLA29_011554, partial [Euroglyphus maynei]
MFAMVGDDRILTVNNEDGDTLIHNTLKGDGSNDHMAPTAVNKNSVTSPMTKSNDNSVCLVLNRRILVRKYYRLLLLSEWKSIRCVYIRPNHNDIN